MGEDDHNGWSDYEKMVMFRLESTERHLNEIYNRLNCIEKSLVSLQVRASLWGAIGGSLATGVIMGLISILFKKMGN